MGEDVSPETSWIGLALKSPEALLFGFSALPISPDATHFKPK
jgi:hypothetical protein